MLPMFSRDWTPRTPPTPRCHHVCACGAELTCGDPARCAYRAVWTCDACVLDAADRYLDRLIGPDPLVQEDR